MKKTDVKNIAGGTKTTVTGPDGSLIQTRLTKCIPVKIIKLMKIQKTITAHNQLLHLNVNLTSIYPL